MKRLGIWLLVLLALTGAGAIAYYFLKPAAPNVALEFSKPDNIYVGVPFCLKVSYTNSSDQVLKDAKFSLQLPSDNSLAFVGQPAGQRVIEMTIGDIGPGSVANAWCGDENSAQQMLVAIGGAQSFKQVSAKLSYSTPSSNVPFEATSNADISIGQPAVGVTITTPQSANSGENFDVDIKIQNNTPDDLKNIGLNLSYPPSFKFVKSNKDNLINNQQYSWPTLPKGQSDEIIVNGNLLGADLSRFDFAAAITTSYSGVNYTINSQTSETGISPSPLVLRTTINNADAANYIAQPDQALDYIIYYKNNSPVPLSSLKLTASLVGAMFDFTTMKTNATFNSITNTLTWTQQNSSDMTVLASGDEKPLEFQVKLKKNYPIQRLGDKNFTLKLGLSLESPTVPPGVAAQKTVSLSQIETKVAGQVALKSSGYFYDASSGILNKGPYPPRVNQKTQYTIHWDVTDYSTDATNAIVTAKLAPGANFTGKVKSTIDAQPTYDQATGVVTWNLGNIQATKGVISAPYEAIFQIEYTPSANQSGEEVQLVGASTLSATDSFTGGNLSAADNEITTSLPDDSKISMPVLNRKVLP